MDQTVFAGACTCIGTLGYRERFARCANPLRTQPNIERVANCFPLLPIRWSIIRCASEMSEPISIVIFLFGA